jgi:hypothetical protein
MINDEAIVDALDDLRAGMHPKFVQWARDMAKGARKNAGKHDPKFVANWQAFERKFAPARTSRVTETDR